MQELLKRISTLRFIRSSHLSTNTSVVCLPARFLSLSLDAEAEELEALERGKAGERGTGARRSAVSL